MTKKIDDYLVCLPDPDQALHELEKAYFVFSSLLDYVAANHPKMLTADFAVDVEQMLSDTWMKYDLSSTASETVFHEPMTLTK